MHPHTDRRSEARRVLERKPCNPALPNTHREIRTEDGRSVPIYSYDQLSSLSATGLMARLRGLEDATGLRPQPKSRQANSLIAEIIRLQTIALGEDNVAKEKNPFGAVTNIALHAEDDSDLDAAQLNTKDIFIQRRSMAPSPDHVHPDASRQKAEARREHLEVGGLIVKENGGTQRLLAATRKRRVEDARDRRDHMDALISMDENIRGTRAEEHLCTKNNYQDEDLRMKRDHMKDLIRQNPEIRESAAYHSPRTKAAVAENPQHAHDLEYGGLKKAPEKLFQLRERAHYDTSALEGISNEFPLKEKEHLRARVSRHFSPGMDFAEQINRESVHKGRSHPIRPRTQQSKIENLGEIALDEQLLKQKMHVQYTDQPETDTYDEEFFYGDGDHGRKKDYAHPEHLEADFSAKGMGYYTKEDISEKAHVAPVKNRDHLGRYGEVTRDTYHAYDERRHPVDVITNRERAAKDHLGSDLRPEDGATLSTELGRIHMERDRMHFKDAAHDHVNDIFSNPGMFKLRNQRRPLLHHEADKKQISYSNTNDTAYGGVKTGSVSRLMNSPREKSKGHGVRRNFTDVCYNPKVGAPQPRMSGNWLAE